MLEFSEADIRLVEKALGLYQEIIDGYKHIIDSFGNYTIELAKKTKSVDDHDYRVQKLFHFFVTKFPHPTETTDEVAAVRMLINDQTKAWRQDINFIIWNIPPVVPIVVVPLMITRHMIAFQDIRFNVRKTFKVADEDVNAWYDFTSVWEQLILAA